MTTDHYNVYKDITLHIIHILYRVILRIYKFIYAYSCQKYCLYKKIGRTMINQKLKNSISDQNPLYA